MTPNALKHQLYRAAHAPAQREELELAAAAWFGGPADEAGWADFIDFFCLEWVDANGATLLEQVGDDTLSPIARRWLTGVRTGVYVVDEVDGGLHFCRDASSEEEICVVVGEALPPRSVLHGRLLPDDRGRFHVSGDPDVYDPMRVIERMTLVRQWLESPRRALLDTLAELRAGFLRQREQRRAFVSFFGSDQLLFPSALELEQHINGFLYHLLFRHLPEGLDGQTFSQHHQATTGEAPVQVKVELSEGLARARTVGVIYDEREGIHFLPDFDAFVAHLQGRAEHPDVVRSYLEDPGVTALPFHRVGEPERLARLIGVPVDTVAALLVPFKSAAVRPAPSVLPHFDG